MRPGEDDVGADEARSDEQAWVEPARHALIGGSRFAGAAALGLVVVIVGVIPFLALLALVELNSPPVRALDLRVADGLNAWLAANPGWARPIELASELGGGPVAVVVFVLTTAWLLIRQQPRLALYVVVTGVGLLVLVTVSKALVGRARPDVAVPIVDLPTNASFPSGHAMTSLVTWGLLMVLAWPRVRRRALLVTVLGLVVVVVGFTRLALGVHFVTDVLAGWALGAAWLAVTTGAFHRWTRDRHDRLHVDEVAAHQASLRLAPVQEPVLAMGRQAWPRLLGAAALITVALIGVGLLLTALNPSLLAWERLLVDQLAQARTEVLTATLARVEWLSGIRGIPTVATATAVLALAYRGSWRPVAFIALAVIGEVAIYGAVSQVVGRTRPDVPDLTAGLPVGASFPSGHVAAATVLYGGVAILLLTYGRGWWRWLSLPVLALVLAATVLGRLYVAAHYPSDTLAGLVLGAAWLAVLARYVLGHPLHHTPGSWRSVLHPPVGPAVEAPEPEPAARGGS